MNEVLATILSRRSAFLISSSNIVFDSFALKAPSNIPPSAIPSLMTIDFNGFICRALILAIRNDPRNNEKSYIWLSKEAWQSDAD